MKERVQALVQAVGFVMIKDGRLWGGRN